jgi:hypothetical protein
MTTTEQAQPDWSKWPEGVGPITWNNLGRPGVGRDNQLYWDGKPVEIRRRLKLSRIQIAGAFVVGLAAIVGGLGTGLNEGFDFGCKLHWWTEGCSK